MRPRVLATVFLLLSLVLCGSASGASYDETQRDRAGDFVTNRATLLYDRPSADSKIVRKLAPRTIVRVVEVTDQWYRVRSTKGGGDGWIRRSYADPFVGGRAASGAGQGGGATSERRRFRVGVFRLTEPVVVHSGPDTASKRITTLREGSQVRIVDKDQGGLWYKVESESGNRPPGWIPTSSAKRVGGDSASTGSTISGGSRANGRSTVSGGRSASDSSTATSGGARRTPYPEDDDLDEPPPPARRERDDSRDQPVPPDPYSGDRRNDDADRF